MMKIINSKSVGELRVYYRYFYIKIGTYKNDFDEFILNETYTCGKIYMIGNDFYQENFRLI